MVFIRVLRTERMHIKRISVVFDLKIIYRCNLCTKKFDKQRKGCKSFVSRRLLFWPFQTNAEQKNTLAPYILLPVDCILKAKKPYLKPWPVNCTAVYVCASWTREGEQNQLGSMPCTFRREPVSWIAKLSAQTLFASLLFILTILSFS